MSAVPRGPIVLAHVFAVAALIVGFVAGALTFAATAGAHATRVASDPVETAELTAAPSRVSATFNEPMQSQFAAMTVIGPDGVQWTEGEPDVDGPVISVGVRAGAPAGDYTVNYRATSADGHVVTGSWSYRVVSAAPDNTGSPPAPAAPAETPAPAESDGDGLPVWPFVAGTTVIVAAGAILAVRRRQ